MEECNVSTASTPSDSDSQQHPPLVSPGHAAQSAYAHLTPGDIKLKPSPGRPVRSSTATSVVFGPGALAAVPDVARKLTRSEAGASVLLLFSASSVGRRWRSTLLASMRSFAVSICEHPFGNPTEATVGEVREAVRCAAAELLIAVGGGGVIDTAKAAAALLGATSPGGRELPVLAIPTTPGTGAEVTPFATVWNYESARKQSVTGARVAPAAAVIDPQLCVGLPGPVLAASALDTLTQGAEAAWSTNSTLESTAVGLSAVALVAEIYEDLIERPDVRTLTAASLAGVQSGQAIAISQTTVCHAISYPLTLRLGLRHGDACSITLGPMLAYNAAVTELDCVDERGAEHVRAVVERIVRALGATTPREAQSRIARFRRLGGLADYGDRSAESSAIAHEALTYGRASNNPRRIAHEQVLSMLRSLEAEPERVNPLC